MKIETVPAAPSNATEWGAFLDEFFAIPANSGTYLLGCLARRVTLYNQQVRALNLVSGLLESGRVRPCSEVAVIGAGAAGMTASAALATKGVRVTVFEDCQDAMQLQAGCQQRYLHPHIYDWPSSDAESVTADLPILNWSANYAHLVAFELKQRWREISLNHAITSHFGVDRLSVVPTNGKLRVNWKKSVGNWNRKHGRPQSDFPVVILAVGFGLEESDPKYWSNDGLNDEFGRERARWLISGHGDGGFTDVMRLCIHNFRHHEILRLFQSAAAMRGVVRDIEALHLKHKENHEALSDEFQNVQTGPLEEKLLGHLRENGPEVFLTGKSAYLYKPIASALNRLIVLVLSNLGAFTILPGPTENVAPVAEGFSVTLAGQSPELFDYVVQRHGPESAFRKCFKRQYESARDLISRWDAVSPPHDLTSRRLWPYGYFGPEAEVSTRAKKPPVHPQSEKYGVHADTVIVHREIRDDGSARTTYTFEGLRVKHGEINRIRFHAGVSCGHIGEPKGDALAKQLKLHWAKDRETHIESGDDMEHRYRKARGTSGAFTFERPLGDTNVASFGFSVDSLNADALTCWESRQMNSAWSQLAADTEGYASVVWFPVSRFVLRLTLPYDCERPHFSRHWPLSDKIDIDDVRKNDELLLRPPLEFAWNPDPDTRFVEGYEFQMVEGEPDDVATREQNEPRTWSATVNMPPVGTRYAVNWNLPQIQLNHWERRLTEKANAWRERLIEGKRELEKENPSRFAATLHARLWELDQQLRSRYWDNLDLFETSFLTYDENTHRLIVVDGFQNGAKPGKDFFEFWLPFGFGLGGAAFRQGRLFAYLQPQDRSIEDLEFYVPLQGIKHTVLTAIPLSHPDFHDGLRRVERSRQSVALVDVGTSSRASPLGNLVFKEAHYIAALCHSVLFGRDIPEPPPASGNAGPYSIPVVTPAGWVRRAASTFSLDLPAQPDADFVYDTGGSGRLPATRTFAARS